MVACLFQTLAHEAEDTGVLFTHHRLGLSFVNEQCLYQEL